MRSLFLSFLFASLISLSGAPTFAQGNDAIHACVNSSSGLVRIVARDTLCRASEVPLELAAAAPAPTLVCPEGTTLFIGVCIETTSRAADTHADARADCGDEGRRLPSGGELEAFAEVPEITLASPAEWTDDVADINEFSVFAYFAVADPGNAAHEANDELPYRCVAGPLVE